MCGCSQFGRIPGICTTQFAEQKETEADKKLDPARGRNSGRGRGQTQHLTEFQSEAYTIVLLLLFAARKVRAAEMLEGTAYKKLYESDALLLSRNPCGCEEEEDGHFGLHRISMYTYFVFKNTVIYCVTTWTI